MVQLTFTRRLCNLAIVLALMVILMGGWTRIMDAGLGCPDWPGCFGQLIVPSSPEQIQQAERAFAGIRVDQEKGWIEMIHRYMAAGLGLLIMTLAWLGWRSRQIEGYPFRLSTLLLGLVIVQGVFGMWTVTLKLMPQVVTLHLLGGLLTLSLLVVLRSRLQTLKSGDKGKRRSLLLRAAVFILFLQILLGGWTSANYAGWACNHWYSCIEGQSVDLDYKAGFSISFDRQKNYQGGVLGHEARAAIQMTHRVGALITALILMLVVIRVITLKHCLTPALLLSVLLFSQLVLGVINVVMAIPVAMAMLHHGVAVFLLLSLLWLKQRYEGESDYGHS